MKVVEQEIADNVKRWDEKNLKVQSGVLPFRPPKARVVCLRCGGSHAVQDCKFRLAIEKRTFVTTATSKEELWRSQEQKFYVDNLPP